jgi:methyl-accepting chemotaxis protein
LNRLSLRRAVFLPVAVQLLATAAMVAAAGHAGTVLAIGAAGLVLSVVLGVIAARKLERDAGTILNWLEQFRTQAAARLTDGLNALAAGNLSVTFPLRSKNENTQLAGEFGRMRDIIEGLRMGLVETFLAYNAATERLRALVGQVSANAAGVTAASSEVASSSEEAGRTSGEIAVSIGQIADGSERQARVVETVQQCADEVAEAATTSAHSVGDAAELAERVRVIGEEGVRASAEADAAMSAVRDSSHAVTSAIEQLAANSAEIGTIVETITGIAGQTNLLALNAAIEAARAGEQGRGFAIVAEEVRKLAEESGRAAEQISALLQTIQTQTEHVVGVVHDGARRTDGGVDVVERAREAFASIDEAAREMHQQIAGISGASGRVTDGASRLRDMISEVTSVAERASASTAQVSASAEESSASAEELAATAQELKTNADELHEVVSRFTLAPSGDGPS